MLLISIVFEESDPPPKEYSPPDIDEGLFKKIGQGDANALEQLYYLTERSLYAYVLSLSKNHDEALELMQETYLKILSAAHLYQPMGKPLAWIFTIARNLFYSQKRRDAFREIRDPADIAADQRFSYVTDTDDRMVLQAVLSILTEEERSIVLLHAVSGFRHREIAGILGLGLSTTLSKYQRALKKLRFHLGKGAEHL